MCHRDAERNVNEFVPSVLSEVLPNGMTEDDVLAIIRKQFHRQNDITDVPEAFSNAS